MSVTNRDRPRGFSLLSADDQARFDALVVEAWRLADAANAAAEAQWAADVASDGVTVEWWVVGSRSSAVCVLRKLTKARATLEWENGVAAAYVLATGRAYGRDSDSHIALDARTPQRLIDACVMANAGAKGFAAHGWRQLLSAEQARRAGGAS